MSLLALIVDDNPNNALVAEFILEELKINSRSLQYAEQTLQQLEQANYDLLLLDWMMPRISGIDVVRSIRQQPAFNELNVIMCTARAQDSDRQVALAAGANAFISKPMTLQSMQATLEALGYGAAPVRGVQ